MDLAGGTLDIWPLGVLHPGSLTVNLAVDLPVTVRLERREGRFRVVQGEEVVEAASARELQESGEGALAGVVAEALALPPVEIHLASASPRGGGLGASSAMAVALIAAAEELLGHAPSSPTERAALARDLEARLMGLPTGTQDHYPPQLGGALALAHLPGGVEVRRLEIDLEAVGRSLLVVYTGKSHFSAGSNWQVVRRRLDGDPESVRLFAGIAESAAALGEALVAGRLPEAGRLVGREWSFRRRLAEGVSTPAIEEILGVAGELGAWGGKACGAGGGGCVAVLCPPERREDIAGRVAADGFEVLPVSPAAEPLEMRRFPPRS